ncbi:MAG: gliding motility-associated lipoprotein [Flavobacteriales bacterium]|nr:gliding motility-associated lipoprotein [Flavobacteriales bacterium]|tara:strand:- start:1726 stop:3024 length:1299 start_codon:yes stop_codon:yes gene_type:complete
MKRLTFLLTFAIALLTACDQGNGELIGVQDRPDWYQPVPYGMLLIPQGSYTMGNTDQDVPGARVSKTKVVSIASFYMDQTEITNNEYRQFVHWVRDSIARKILAEEVSAEEFSYEVNVFGEDLEPPTINWDARIDWYGEEEREALEVMFLPDYERFYNQKQWDTRKFMFEYSWIDYKEAASRFNREQGQIDRSVFIKNDIINVYPDTLAWVHDFTYAYNEPMTNSYFWHPAYDEYPVVGVSWKQARAFSIWRTELLNGFLRRRGMNDVQYFRLPTESEWEWAARGGLDQNQYPWGGPYIRNTVGCFLGNFKPMRGNYVDDGGLHTVKVTAYNPNDYGLFCMAGNVAEWTSNAFDEAAYDFAHDLNADYSYEAKESDPPSLKRKVIRGGSWKDVAYFLRNGSRTFEYQDTAKCYIGFRNVMSYLGRPENNEEL